MYPRRPKEDENVTDKAMVDVKDNMGEFCGLNRVDSHRLRHGPCDVGGDFHHRPRGGQSGVAPVQQYRRGAQRDVSRA